MPVKIHFKFCPSKLLLKTFCNEFIMSFKPKHCYNTRNDEFAVQKANNKRGERSLLCSGVPLYNRSLKGVRIGAKTGFPRDLASCLWKQGQPSLIRVHAPCALPNFQVFEFQAFQLGSLHSGFELSGWPFACLLFCHIFYSIYFLV